MNYFRGEKMTDVPCLCNKMNGIKTVECYARTFMDKGWICPKCGYASEIEDLIDDWNEVE